MNLLAICVSSFEKSILNVDVCSKYGWVEKMWYKCTEEFYSAFNQERILSLVMAWTILEDTVK